MNYILLTLLNDMSIMVNMDHVTWVQDMGDVRRIGTRGPTSVADVTETLEQIAGYLTELEGDT